MAPLNTLRCLHVPPINQIVSLVSQMKHNLGNGFVLRCFQCLSVPNLATRLCPWQNNRYTMDSFFPVLSY
ncbi:MAG: hypothetical protein CMI52_02610 [Parcubacteria group bacterium]|nr:hypothetical protein [Parcubacteria group bacterium]